MGNVVRLLPPPATLTSFFPVPPSLLTHTHQQKVMCPLLLHPSPCRASNSTCHKRVTHTRPLLNLASSSTSLFLLLLFLLLFLLLLLLLSAVVVGGIVVVVVVLVSSPFLCRRPSSLPLSLSSSSASSSSGRVAMAITTDSCGSPSGSEPTPPSFALPTYASALPRSCRQLPERVRLLMLLHQCVLCCECVCVCESVRVCVSLFWLLHLASRYRLRHRIWPKHRPSFPNNFVDVDEQQHAVGKGCR